MIDRYIKRLYEACRWNGNFGVNASELIEEEVCPYYSASLYHHGRFHVLIISWQGNDRNTYIFPLLPKKQRMVLARLRQKLRKIHRREENFRKSVPRHFKIVLIDFP